MRWEQIGPWAALPDPDPCDAYLHWVLAGGLRHFNSEAADAAQWLTLVVEWREGERWLGTLTELRQGLPYGQVQVITVPGQGLRFAVVSRRVQPGEVAEEALRTFVAGLAPAVRAMEWTAPVAEAVQRQGQAETELREAPLAQDRAPTARTALLSGRQRLPGPPVYAVIDDVIPFSNALWSKRVERVWLQGAPAGEGVTEVVMTARAQRRVVMASASEYRATANAVGDLTLPQRRCFLSHALMDEEALEDMAVELGFPEVRRRFSHGAHVVDTLMRAAPMRERLTAHPEVPPALVRHAAEGVAPRLIGVQLPARAVRDNSGRWLAGHVMAGLFYIVTNGLRRPRRIVANVSYGPSTGPRDGTSLLERAMDALCEHFDGTRHPTRLSICVPAGNGYGDRAHACLTIGAGEQRALTWRVLPDGRRPAFVECWVEGTALAAEQLEVSITAPGADAAGAWLTGPGAWRAAAATGHPAHAFLRIGRSVHGRVHLLLALEPTGLDAVDAPAPAGDWRIALRHGAAQPITMHAYIGLATPSLWGVRDGTLSYFVDPVYDPERYMHALGVDDPASGQVVMRRGTITGMATGRQTWVATGYQVFGSRPTAGDVRPAAYASAGPGQPAGVGPGAISKQPTASFPTDESPALDGVLGAGNRGAVRVRLVGTSTASPQMAHRLMHAQRGMQVLPSGALGPVARMPADPDRSGFQVDP